MAAYYINALYGSPTWTGTTGVGTTLTYGFASNTFPYNPGYPFSVTNALYASELSSNGKSAANYAIGQASSIANLTFNKMDTPYVKMVWGVVVPGIKDPIFGFWIVPPVYGYIPVAGFPDIVWGAATIKDGHSGYGFSPNPVERGSGLPTLWGDILLDPSYTSGGLGTFTYTLALHELGHALGLKHPFDTNLFSGTTLTGTENTLKYTVMAYNTYAFDQYPVSYMLYDIAALQYMYGAKPYATGNDTYSYDFLRYTRTIWDSAGIDTIDASAAPLASKINLNAGTFSSIGRTVNYGYNNVDNLAIAFGVTIENATGGAYNDTITGNEVANTLIGNSGSDTIYGNGGNDYIVGDALGVLSASDGYDYLYGGDGNDTIVGGGGGDWIDGGNGDDVLASSAYILSTGAPDGSASILGGSGNDIIYGSWTDDYLSGGDGNDVIVGGNGNDYYDSGAGLDQLTGGTGNDTYNISNASDFITDVGGTSDTVILRTPGQGTTYTMPSGIENIFLVTTSSGAMIYTNSLTNAVSGSQYDDWVIGSLGNDTLYGYGGNDTMFGGSDNNILDGGAGNDYLFGGLGNDAYYFGSGYGSDIINENDAAIGNTDRLGINPGTGRDQLWFSRSGTDLLINIIGTNDRMTIAGWYNGAASHVEQIYTSQASTLFDTKVQNLVNAMAGLAMPTTTTLSAAYHSQLDSVIAANWT